MAPPRLPPVLLPLVLLAASCGDRGPARPGLTGVEPAAARVLAPTVLRLLGENLHPRLSVDFSTGASNEVGGYRGSLLGPGGDKVALDAVTRVSGSELRASVAPGIAPGVYALVLEDPWGNQSRLEGAFRALAACERADGAGPYVGDPCDGDDADLCPDDRWECVEEMLVCSAGAANPETCDGVDNDCNPATEDGADEPGLATACDGTLDGDLCNEGSWVCSGGPGLSCSDPNEPTPELCDGVDNDCNPATLDGADEPALATACDGSADTDLCEEGTYVCSGGPGLSCDDQTTDGCQAHFEVGSFRKSTGTAPVLQTVPHGLKDTPKALILWTGGATITGYLESHRFSFGVTDAKLGSGAVGAASANGEAGGLAHRRMQAAALTVVSPWSTLLAEAEVVGWDAQGFTLRWNVNDPALPDIHIHYLVISGEAVDSTVRNWQTPTATGAAVVTGMGFRPDAVLHLHAGNGYVEPLGSTDTHGIFGLGGMDAAGNQWAYTAGAVYASTTNTARGSRSTGAILMIDMGTNVLKTAALTSMDADGFTMQVTTSQAAASQVFSLGLVGLSARTTCFQQEVSVSAQSVAGVGFQPQALLLSSLQMAVDDVRPGALFSLGASDGAAQGVFAFTDRDNLLASEVESVTRLSACYVEARYPAFSGTDGARASLSAFHADGFNLDWLVTDTTSTRMCYAAFAP